MSFNSWFSHIICYFQLCRAMAATLHQGGCHISNQSHDSFVHTFLSHHLQWQSSPLASFTISDINSFQINSKSSAQETMFITVHLKFALFSRLFCAFLQPRITVASYILYLILLFFILRVSSLNAHNKKFNIFLLLRPLSTFHLLSKSY